MSTSIGAEDRLYQTVAAVLGVDPTQLNEQSSPQTITAWDSLNHLNLVMALESEFELTLRPEETLDMHDIGSIRRIINQSDEGTGENITFRDCRREDITALKAFIAKSYGENYVLGVNDEYFDWQYRETPISRGEDYHLRLALVNGQIAGCLGYIPLELTAGRSVVNACWLANWMVDPDSRHLGLGPVLAREVANLFQVTLALGANEEARDILSRMGWTDFGDLQRYVRILDVDGAQALSETGRLDWPLSAELNRVGQTDTTVHRVERFDQSVTDIWDRVWGQQPLAAGTRRTAEFLNWRYADHRQFDYRLFAAERNGKPVGFAVYRVEQARDMPISVGRILELVGEDHDQPALLNTVLNDAKQQGAVAADYFCCGSHAEALMLEHGFLPGKDPAAAQVPTLYQPIDRRRSNIRFLADLRNLPGADQYEAWYVSKADGDQDRPN